MQNLEPDEHLLVADCLFYTDCQKRTPAYFFEDIAIHARSGKLIWFQSFDEFKCLMGSCLWEKFVGEKDTHISSGNYDGFRELDICDSRMEDI